MRSFTKLTSRIVPLVRDDIDTDQIVPARFLKGTEKVGLAKALFADWRKGPNGLPREDFPLLQPEAKGAEVLLAGANFGCGSSREHAPWALVDFGFRVIIARSFADIFRGNAAKNGLLTVALDQESHARLVALRERDAAAAITVHLPEQAVEFPDGLRAPFSIDPFSKHCLIEGIDELGFLLSFEGAISAYEAKQAPIQ